MKNYNKIMITMWLIIAIVLTLFITYKGFTQGFSRWGMMYIFAGIAFFAYFMRRLMARKYEAMNQAPNQTKNTKK